METAVAAHLAAQPGSITPTPTGATVANQVHRIRADIDGGGLAIDGARLVVQAWGRTGSRCLPPTAGTVSTSAEHVVVQHAGMHEIITTSAHGVRHDIVIEERPPGHGDLVLEVRCNAGHFEPKNASGAELVIRDRRMTYDRLQVVDAAGRVLAAHMAVIAGNVRIEVQDAEARYPVVVDPTISATRALATARHGHTATLLPSGKVLVIGGYLSATALATCEIYDPRVGTWSATGALATARAFHTATLLPSGKVLVTAGYGTSVFLTSCELYDPNTGTWSDTGPLTTERTYHTSTLLPSGKVLVTGGLGFSGKLTSCELYDPSAGTWGATGALTTERDFHTATLLPSGKVLVTGGRNYSSVYLTACELYDPNAGTWNGTGALATGRFNHTATLLPSGKVLVTGGAILCQ